MSECSPLVPNLCLADLYEANFLRMEDKQWNEFLASRASTDEGLVSGDSVFDEMERRLFAELDVAEEVETNSASDGTTELDQKPETLNA